MAGAQDNEKTHKTESGGAFGVGTLLALLVSDLPGELGEQLTPLIPLMIVFTERLTRMAGRFRSEFVFWWCSRSMRKKVEQNHWLDEEQRASLRAKMGVAHERKLSGRIEQLDRHPSDGDSSCSG